LSAAAHKHAARVVRVLIASWLLLAARAQAAEVTRVVSTVDTESRVDFNLTLSWLHEVKSAFVKRESESGSPPTIDLIKDLQFNEHRDALDLRVDIGILWDVGFHVDLPVVLSDVSSLSFDQSSSNCVFPGMGPTPTCVNAQNSTILRDGILPLSPDGSTYGLDAQHNRPFSNPSSGVFRGPDRHGLENLGLGVTWAVFNQARDDTKPTWTLGFEARLDIFGDMRFDPANPGANTAVGPGYHQFLPSTTVSKRFKHFEPYFFAWYMLPIRTNGSIYQQYLGGNQGAVNPQQQAGVFAGFEAIVWENPRKDQGVTLEFRGRASEHFFGRSASELWQPLSGSSACKTDPTQCRPGLDEDLDGDGKPDPYPGVTETQAYASFGGDAGINIHVGRYVRFRALGGLTLDMPHFITFASAGVDRPDPTTGKTDGRVDSTATTTLPNGRTIPTEGNPVYRELIDIPGRRFKVEGTQIWSLFVQGSIMF
jgi:hypothetical protein